MIAENGKCKECGAKRIVKQELCKRCRKNTFINESAEKVLA
tara:strand:- start:1157 stop:1279 length:123 start_codon:yes stop_codon:yes gene_type:complete